MRFCSRIIDRNTLSAQFPALAGEEDLNMIEGSITRNQWLRGLSSRPWSFGRFNGSGIPDRRDSAAPR